MRRLVLIASIALALTLPPLATGEKVAECSPGPTPVETPPPPQPNVRLATPVEGYAILEFTVTEDGDVTDVELIQAYAPPSVPGLAASYALSAIAAVKDWTYEPAKTRCRVREKLSFSLEGSDE